jgi:hypothetical protein
MKPISIASASALALGLALSSLPAQAQKNSASASTPGGGGGLAAGSNAVSPTVQIIQLIEVIQTGPKGSTAAPKASTWRIEPTGATFSGPVNLCLKYNSGSAQISQVGNSISSALTTMLKEIKDKSGKSTYTRAPGDPVNDKLNSQLCVRLVSF